MFKRIIGRLRSNYWPRKRLRHALLLLLLFWALLAHGLNAQASGHRSPLIRSPRPQQGAVAQSTPQLTMLESGKPIERQLSSRQTHGYQIRLVRGQHATVSLEQRGIDVVVELLGTDNELITEFDGEIRNQGKETIAFVADTTGAYMLVVKAKLKGVPAGFYEIRVTETRAATDDDRSLQEARKLQTQFARLHRVGKYDEARPLVERALAIAERVLGADHVYVALLIAGLGNSYHAKVDNAKAKPLYERAFAILEKEFGPDHPQTAYVTNRLGLAYHNTNDVATADKLFNRALEVSEKHLGPEHPQVALCLQDLGELHDDRGDTAKAEQLFQRALTIAEKTLGTEDSLLAVVLNNLGVHYLERRDYERAEQFLQRSLAVREKLFGPEHLDLANVLQNLGVIARERKDYAKAENYYLRALSIREKGVGTEHRDVAANLINIANLYRAKGDYAKSLEIHLRSLKILERTAGPFQWVTVVSLGNIARTYAAMGDLANAIKFQSRVDAALETGIALNLVIGSERQKRAFLDTVSSRTDRAISLNMQLAPGSAEASTQAALVLLQRKGRLLDAMTDTLAAVRQHSDTQDRNLLDQLNETTTQLARLVLNGPQKMSPEEHQKAVKDLEEKKEKLEAEISRDSAEFRAQSQPITLEAVQAAIPTGAALVEFAAYRPFDPKAESTSEAYGETRYVAYVVRRQGAPQGKDLGEAKVIDGAVDALRQALRDPSRRDARELARSLDEKVMQPVRVLVGNATQLLVSPDGALNLIPFEALVDEQERYLIERYSFAYLTSGRDLLRMQVARASKSKSLVIANPSFGEPVTEQIAKTNAVRKPTTPNDRRRSVTAARDLSEVYFASLGGTAQEARSIHTLFPDAHLLTGEQATESTLKQVAAPRVLHIATHGFFLQNTVGAAATNVQVATRGIDANAKIENPLLRSGLALAGANLRTGNNDDGILTALEASGLNLWGTKLVVLSACDTGLGEVRNGEGVYGLRRAFVLAGAESLVMSLWPASDYSTRELMTKYYKNLKQEMGRGAALRQVQLDMLKRNKQLHPFYWANFIQSGEWANLDGKR